MYVCMYVCVCLIKTVREGVRCQFTYFAMMYMCIINSAFFPKCIKNTIVRCCKPTLEFNNRQKFDTIFVFLIYSFLIHQQKLS